MTYITIKKLPIGIKLISKFYSKYLSYSTYTYDGYREGCDVKHPRIYIKEFPGLLFDFNDFELVDELSILLFSE